MLKLTDKMKKIIVVIPVLLLSICILFIYQNCGDIRVSSIQQVSEQCVPPTDLAQYSIALYAQTATSDKFEIVDSQGAATGISAQWNDGVDRGEFVIFEDDFGTATTCTIKTITAKFEICSQQYTLTQNVNFGPGCTPVIIPPGGDPDLGCPATLPADPNNPNGTQLTRLNTSNLIDTVHGADSSHPAWNNVNTTEWNDVFNFAYDFRYTPPYNNFPGMQGSRPYIANFKKNNYIALHFKTPPLAQFGQMSGMFTYPSNYPGSLNGWRDGIDPRPHIDMSITTASHCGDFTVVCSRHDFHSFEGIVLSWYGPEVNPGFQGCVLQADTDYYLNIKLTNPDTEPACLRPHAGQYCPIGFIQNFNR